jgi:hypothetical protein
MIPLLLLLTFIQDNSDAQYSTFRENAPYMALVMILHPLCRRMYDAFWRTSTYTTVKTTPGKSNGLTQGLSAASAANVRLEQRATFDVYFGLVFLMALNGTSAAKVLLILYANYKIATVFPRNYVPAATWIFNVGTLFGNELCRGYKYEAIAQLLSLSSLSEKSGSSANWGTWLDNHGGLIPRWEILFNITILRLISFNMDYHWSLSMRGGSPIEVRHEAPLSGLV